MRISVEGKLLKDVTAKDIALTLFRKYQHRVERVILSSLRVLPSVVWTMEGRMTLCNMSIECGARGGMIAPDEVTFEYIKGRKFAPKDKEWNDKLALWKQLKSDDNAIFDAEYQYDASDIEPMITYGTNPGMGIGVNGNIPSG